MSEVKVEVGQVWIDDHDDEFTVLATYVTDAWVKYDGYDPYTVDTESFCIYTLQEPWTPEPGEVIEIRLCPDTDMWEARVFVEMCEEQYVCLNRYREEEHPDEVLDPSSWTYWHEARPCEPTEVIKLPVPEFKLFEAYSKYRALDYPVGSKAHTSDDTRFRIFGYTDDAEWPDKVSIRHAGNVPYYDTDSCDWTGDRKFAIGRRID